MNPNERTLELDKILELLAQEAANDMTREQARKLQPQTDLAVVQAELEKTDSAISTCCAVWDTTVLCLSRYVYRFAACKGWCKTFSEGFTGNCPCSAASAGIERLV